MGKSADLDALRTEFNWPAVMKGFEVASKMDYSTAHAELQKDGLADDLNKLLTASGVGAELDAGALPLSANLRAVRASDALECALTGGDDYELCFTARPSDDARLRKLAARWSAPVTRIGTIVPGPGARWRLDGKSFVVPDSTFRHF
jgi:thiamine-monophosphate kinase